MKDSILCAIDLTDSSRDALRWAVTLAKKLKSPLTILHAYRLTKPQKEEAVEMKKDIEIEATKKFGLLEKEFLAGQGVTYEFKSEVGFVSDRVKDHLKRNSISFVVLAKGNPPNKESYEALMDSSKVPVIVVP